MPSAETPMLKQYLSIKMQHTDSILFFRLGDFYEMFFEDAVEASKILDIALTARNKGEPEPVPLCGVPYHACQPYIAKLLAAGKKVAICEQIEDPKLSKGIVKREVVRIVTPGMIFDDTVLESSKPNYLVGLCCDGKQVAIASLDISTSDFKTGVMNSLESALDEIAKLDPKELLIRKTGDETWVDRIKKRFPDTLISTPFDSMPDSHGFENLEGVPRIRKDFPQALEAARILWDYACYTQKTTPAHIHLLGLYEVHNFLLLDGAAQKNLDLETLRQLLNQTFTSMGARKLRNWLFNPLLDRRSIEKRQQGIQLLLDQFGLQQALEKSLVPIADLERIVGRVTIGTANARDLVALARSLAQFPFVIEACANKEGLLGESVSFLDGFQPLVKKITETLVDNPPMTLREGGLIGNGVHPELDELRTIRGQGKNFIAALEEKERQRTSINSLKVRFNRVFGYYIEITHTHRERVPAHYIRKQTLVNAERYITPELKEYEERVLGAEERIHQIEYELFLSLSREVMEWGKKIQKGAEAIATLDVLFSLAQTASQRRWTCPQITEANEIAIQGGRHPVIESLLKDPFVPNDIFLDEEDNRFLMITGPNMAGKSTVMRQTALIVILAQMGSFVPAARARLGIIDKIFTRVGASDRLARGESTFMVEMVETAHILKEATARSLVVVDEIGRGTSTYDGVAIAWAVAEYLHSQIRAKTLFATHYHELIELSNSCSGIKNFNIAVKEWNDQVIFLRKLVPGGTSKSYGVEVAKLAGLPLSVVRRAKEILSQWERRKGDGNHENQNQLPLGLEASLLVKEIENADINHLTPLQALEFLSHLKSRLS